MITVLISNCWNLGFACLCDIHTLLLEITSNVILKWILIEFSEPKQSNPTLDLNNKHKTKQNKNWKEQQQNKTKEKGKQKKLRQIHGDYIVCGRLSTVVSGG